MDPKFLQIHFLTAYPSALLNRDDAGFAKRIPFGGAVRTRISSQCVKRHWRTHEGDHSLASLDAPMSLRSRLTFDRHLFKPLVEAGIAEEIAKSATETIMTVVLGKSEKAKAKEAEEADVAEVVTNQVTVLGPAEMEFFRQQAIEVCKESKDAKAVANELKQRLTKGEGRKNLQALKAAAGLDAALFGRMVTSDVLARGDAAVHVAHLFTVHAEASEADYFSAVDDLLSQGDEAKLGSGHINSTELTSGLYYGYVVVDVPLLVANLEGCDRKEAAQADKEMAGKVVNSLIHLIATVSPGAKLGSTAPYNYASMVLAEAGNSQPRSLANAFISPVQEHPDLLANTYAALANHITDFTKMYGNGTDKRIAAQGPVGSVLEAIDVKEPVSLDDLAQWAEQQVRGEL